MKQHTMMTMILLCLACAFACIAACASTIDPMACLDVDLTPIPGEPISTDGCGSLQNVAESVHAGLGCPYGERPDYRAACPYGAEPIPQHTWQECAELIRTARSCDEVIALERSCSCEGSAR